MITNISTHTHTFLNWYLLPPLQNGCYHVLCVIIRELKKRIYNNLQNKREGCFLVVTFSKRICLCTLSGSCYHHLMPDIAAFSCGYELESNSLSCYILSKPDIICIIFPQQPITAPRSLKIQKFR